MSVPLQHPHPTPSDTENQTPQQSSHKTTAISEQMLPNVAEYSQTHFSDPPINPPKLPPDHNRFHDNDRKPRALSPRQLQALPLLIAGLSDNEVARRIGVTRHTVNRWRLFDPLFLSRLNRERDALWNNTLDSLRALLPQSVATLAESLNSPNESLKYRAAILLLKVAGTSRLAPRTGPIMMSDIVAKRFHANRANFYPHQCLKALDPPCTAELDLVHDGLLEHIADEEAKDLPPTESP